MTKTSFKHTLKTTQKSTLFTSVVAGGIRLYCSGLYSSQPVRMMKQIDADWGLNRHLVGLFGRKERTSYLRRVDLKVELNPVPTADDPDVNCKCMYRCVVTKTSGLEK